MSDLPALVKVTDACRELGIGRTTLYTLLNRGELVGFKDRGRRRITRQSLEGYIKRHSRRAKGLRVVDEGQAG